MKRTLLLIIFTLALYSQSSSQSIFWSDYFTVASGICDPTDPAYGWTVTDIDTQGTDANYWYIFHTVNCQRSDTCESLNTDTLQGALYISYGNVCDSAIHGAVYRNGCFNATHKRVESPLIDCTGKTNITLDFDYLSSVFPPHDFGTMLLSFDGGSTWTNPYSLNSGFCPLNNHTAYWKHYQLQLPSTADNIPDLKIAFEWENNADCFGALFSIAIDNIEIKHNCAIPVTILAVEQHPQLCAGHSYTFEADTINTSDIFYDWIWGDNIHVSNPDVDVLYNNPGTYTINLTITDTNGCIGQADTTITIIGFSINLSTNTDTICPYECINFSSAVNPSSSATYAWSLTGGSPSTSSIQNPSSCFNNAGNHTATLTVSDTSICSRTNSVNFFVDTCGYPIISSIENNENDWCVCTGTCLDFTSTSYDATSYDWTFPGGNPNTSTSASPTNVCFDTAGTHAIQLEATNLTGSTILTRNLIVVDYPPKPTLTYNASFNQITITNFSPNWYYLYFYETSTMTWDYLGAYSSSTINIGTLTGTIKMSAVLLPCDCETDSDPLTIL